MENHGSSETITRGDIVVLKSGGPKMTVQNIGDATPGPRGPITLVTCIWISNDHGTVCEHTFNKIVLKKAESN